jgi:hypothetical protein
VPEPQKKKQQDLRVNAALMRTVLHALCTVLGVSLRQLCSCGHSTWTCLGEDSKNQQQQQGALPEHCNWFKRSQDMQQRQQQQQQAQGPMTVERDPRNGRGCAL